MYRHLPLCLHNQSLWAGRVELARRCRFHFYPVAQHLAARRLYQFDYTLVDLAAEHHLDKVHGVAISDTHATDKVRFLTHTLEHLADLRAAAMNHYRVQAYLFHQHDVAGKALLQAFIGHRITAEFDDNGLATETLDVRQGFVEYLCSNGRCCRCRRASAHRFI